MRYLYIFIFLVIFLGTFKFINDKGSYPNLDTPKDILGKGNIEIEVFADIECPICHQSHKVMKQIESEFNVKIIYYHFPLTHLHKNAFKAAEAAECANDQGKFWDYVNLAHKNYDKLKNSDLKNYAKEINLDFDTFEKCLESGAKKKVIKKDIREGLKRDVQGTPTFYINGNELEKWKYESFKAAIIQ